MKYKKIFIACPISKYLTADGICKDFEILEGVYHFIQIRKPFCIFGFF